MRQRAATHHKACLQAMARGTAPRPAARIAHDAELLGGSPGGAVDRDGAALEMTVTSNQLPPALRMIADAARRPAAADAGVARAGGGDRRRRYGDPAAQAVLDRVSLRGDADAAAS